MKTRLSLFFILLFVFCTGVKTWAEGVQYCTPTMKNAMVGYIEKIVTTGASVNLNFVDPDAKTNSGAGHYTAIANKVVDSNMKVLPGQEITLTTSAQFAMWGQIHIFVDADADGNFSASERVAHFGKGGGGTNEADLQKDQTTKFTIPAELVVGTNLRMRVVIAGGTYAASGNNGCSDLTNQEGAFYDFEIEVQNAMKSYAVTFGPSENGTFTVKNGETSITTDANVEEGTVLTVDATPADGYELSAIKVNGVAISGKTFTVTAATTVEVLFEALSEPGSMTAIHFSGTGKQQFRFKDILLGTDGGSLATDKRIYNMTLSAWVKPLAGSGDILAHVQPNMYPSTGSFAVRLTDGKLMLFSRCRNADGGFPDNSAIRTQTETALNVGEWAFVTLAIDDTNKKMYLYKDGELVLEQPLNEVGVGLLHDAGMVFVAGHLDFNGDIDEVQVWNKTLTQTEIKASMGSYASTPDGLLYHYTFTNKADDHTFANLGMGGECKGMFVAGKEVNHGWWTEYQYSTQEPQMAEGHVLAKYTLTYESETTGGSFVVKNGENAVVSGTELNEGTLLTIVATPTAGYQVKSIKVNGEAIEGNSFNLAADAIVTVEFSNKLLLNYAYNEAGGEVIVKSGENVIANEGEFVKNSPITITVAPKVGYEVKTFTVNGEDKKSGLVGNNYQIANCNENLDINVEFAIKIFTITYATPESGSIQVKAGSRTVNSGSTVDYGTELTVKLIPSAVSALTSFTINDVEKKAELDKDNKMVVTVTENLTLAAIFKDATYKIVYTNTTPEFGTVVAKNYEDDSDIANNSDVTKGNYVMVVCTPKDADQTVTSLKNNGEVVDLESDSSVEITGNVVTYTIDMQEDMTIEVAFSTPVGISKQNAEVMAYYDAKAQTLNIKEDASAILYNLAGNAVLSSSEKMIDVSALSAGCYLVKVNASGNVKTVKFIKK